MLSLRQIIYTTIKFQLRLDHAKVFSTLSSDRNFSIAKYREYNQKNYQKGTSLTLMQLLIFNKKLHQNHFLSKIMKAILNIYNINQNSSTATNTTKSRSNQFQQYQRLHHIKALMITNETATYNLFICQNIIGINMRKLSQYSDSDFFILKAESCVNFLSNLITEFINNINSLQTFFSFNLNIVLNGNDRENLGKDQAIILADNNNNNRNIIKIYSANKFGANLICKCIRFKKNLANFLKGDTNNKSLLNTKKMSKVATEQPPIDISKANTTNDSTKELSSSGSGGHGITSATSSSSGSGSNTNNNIEKQEKGSCFTSSLGDIIKFLELVGGLKHTKRTGFVLRDVKNCESISGHMYRMAMMTFLLDGTEGLNQTKCMELALVHDLAECIVGDLTPFCGVTKEDKKRMEMDAMEKICKLIEPRGKRMWELFVEYEGGESPESKFVKDLDRLDMVLQAFEYEKRDDCLMKHQEFFDSTEGKFEHTFVQKLVKEIYDQRDKLANENGCTPNMYPQPACLQNGHHQNGDDSTTVVNGDDEQSSSISTTKTPNETASSSASSSSLTDLDQKKATNGR